MLKFSIFCLLFVWLMFGFLQAEDEEDLKADLDSVLMESGLFGATHYEKDDVSVLDYSKQKQWPKLCQEGKNQSPVNIITSKLAKPETEEELKLRYKNVKITEIKNIGTTLILNMKGSASIILNNVQYILQYGIVHIPSEHAIDGKRALVEFQAVHKSYHGEYLVLSILFYEGESNKSLLQVLLAAPEKAGETKTFDETINPKDFLPDISKGYYYYSGSLTVPPCTENTSWLIMKDIKYLYKARLEVWFRTFKPNFRSIQKLGDRKIYDY